MSKNYNFYCLICGEPFLATKSHAKTCSTECRVVLSNVVRYERTDGELVTEGADRKEVAEKYEKTTGEKMSDQAIKRIPEKKKKEEEEKPAFIKRFSRKKKSEKAQE